MKTNKLWLLTPLIFLLGACSLQGEPGPKGEDGRSIVQIIKTNSDGNVDTYTIVYSDTTTSTFTVTNGKNGEDAHSPEVTINEDGYWCIDGKPTSIIAKGDKGDSITDVTSTYDEDGNTIVKITLSTGEERYVTILKGDKGDQGPKGDKGDKGDKGEDGKDAVTYIPCIFNNYDGTKLYEFYYEKGSNIVYDGPTPVKTTIDDDGKTLDWSFVGWDKSLNNIRKPTIFTAKFEYLYTCEFVNYDGTVLETKTINRGESASYDGPTPTKPSEVSGNQTIDWAFIGWDKELGNIKSDTVFTAQYDSPNAIKLTFNNYDGTYLYTQYCGSSANVTYQGPAPTKADVESEDGIITKYEFAGFDKSLKGIKEDTTFTATFSEVTYYRCRFFDGDGSLLYTTSAIADGKIAYKGETPTKEQEANGTTITEYNFKSWDKSLTGIKNPTDFYSLFESRKFTGYKVTFKDSDDNGILYSHYFEENTDASYPYETPWYYNDDKVTMFFGWSGSLLSITKETTVHMNLKTISREQNGEYPQSKVTDKALLNKLNSVDKTNIDLENDYLELDERSYKAVVTSSSSTKSSYDYFAVEPIRWRYLGQDKDSALLLSEEILDAKRYNKSYDGQDSSGFYANNYKESEIRKWLNDSFLNQAFENVFIIKTTNVDNSLSSTGSNFNNYVCDTTFDKVFLLSCSEISNQEYGFLNRDSKIAFATDFAKSQGVLTIPSNNASYWWLRSPDDDYSYNAYCLTSGGIITNLNVQNGFHDSYCGVRPAIRISLN